MLIPEAEGVNAFSLDYHYLFTNLLFISYRQYLMTDFKKVLTGKQKH